jgi:hypothetical protein
MQQIFEAIRQVAQFMECFFVPFGKTEAIIVK